MSAISDPIFSMLYLEGLLFDSRKFSSLDLNLLSTAFMSSSFRFCSMRLSFWFMHIFKLFTYSTYGAQGVLLLGQDVPDLREAAC